MHITGSTAFNYITDPEVTSYFPPFLDNEKFLNILDINSVSPSFSIQNLDHATDEAENLTEKKLDTFIQTKKNRERKLTKIFQVSLSYPELSMRRQAALLDMPLSTLSKQRRETFLLTCREFKEITKRSFPLENPKVKLILDKYMPNDDLKDALNNFKEKLIQAHKKSYLKNQLNIRPLVKL